MALGSHQGEGGGKFCIRGTPLCGGRWRWGADLNQLPLADGPKLLSRRLTPRAVSRRAIILLPHTALL